MKKILIVEDDKLLASALKIMLEANGFECAVALEGYYAIQYAFKDRPDLVITDLGLPAGDGFKVIQTLKNSIDLMSTPIIVMTGKTDEDTINKIKGLGIALYFLKPFDRKELLEAVKKEMAV